MESRLKVVESDLSSSTSVLQRAKLEATLVEQFVKRLKEKHLDIVMKSMAHMIEALDRAKRKAEALLSTVPPIEESEKAYVAWMRTNARVFRDAQDATDKEAKASATREPGSVHAISKEVRNGMVSNAKLFGFVSLLRYPSIRNKTEKCEGSWRACARKLPQRRGSVRRASLNKPRTFLKHLRLSWFRLKATKEPKGELNCDNVVLAKLTRAPSQVLETFEGEVNQNPNKVKEAHESWTVVQNSKGHPPRSNNRRDETCLVKLQKQFR